MSTASTHVLASHSIPLRGTRAPQEGQIPGLGQRQYTWSLEHLLVSEVRKCFFKNNDATKSQETLERAPTDRTLLGQLEHQIKCS